MRDNDRAIVDPLEAVLSEVRRRLAAGREGNFVAELGGPDLGYVLYWARLTTAAPPGDPPDERYIVTEVRPTGIGTGGAIEWNAVPDGRTDITAWNVAEAIDRTHELPADTVVLVREELDLSSPPEFRAIFFRPVGGGGGSRMCRVESYQSSTETYTVQPVVWADSMWTADGSPISGVPNVGEVQDGEQGYLAGPSGEAIYARLYEEGGDSFLVVHPPRMP
ncbi:MAG: hypothetical protein JXL80_09990 [Planctomycetes bacterium]|nr:hypothetical protein [Planctomycetota bacterium]